MQPSPAVTRRSVIVAGSTIVVGAGAVALAGCTAPAGTGDTGASSLPPGTELTLLSAIPVGGSLGVQIGGAAILVSRPGESTAAAFSAICPHQGCVVAAAGDIFDCPCHGSRYDAATGALLNGPSTEPLTEIAVTVDGDRVLVA